MHGVRGLLALVVGCRYLDIRVSRVYKHLHKKEGVKMNEIASKFRADFEAGLTYWDTDPVSRSPTIKLTENGQLHAIMPSSQSAIRALQLHLMSPKHEQESMHPVPQMAAGTTGGVPTGPGAAQMLDPVEAIVQAAAISQPQQLQEPRMKLQALQAGAVVSATEEVLSPQQADFRQQDSRGLVNDAGASEMPLPPSAVARQSLLGLRALLQNQEHHECRHPHSHTQQPQQLQQPHPSPNPSIGQVL